MAARLGLIGALAMGALVSAPAAPASALASTTPLPTVQINGVVWDQVIVGNTVYATGSFTAARPPGAAKGTNETPRSNVLAYDLTTGALNTSWAPSLNAQGVAIAASEDGSRIFVGGDFTQVNGVNKYRIVSLDAKTGAIDVNFKAKTDARVRALTVGNGVVYAGGSFGSANNVTRAKAAAFLVSNGSLTTWAPSADMYVDAVLFAPRGNGTNQVVLGGAFSTINGATNFGMASTDPTTGAVLSWPANQIIKNGGNTGLAITSLRTDGRQIYGSGFNRVTYKAGWLEGTFAADLSGNLKWVDGCHGDSYSVYPGPDALYKMSHQHDCAQIGDSFVQTSPSGFRRAASFTLDAAPGRSNVSGDFIGQPAPASLSWRPYFPSGTFTGQDQGPWTVTGNGEYLVIGGEFQEVEGSGQQGLVRFRLTSPQTPTGDPTVAQDSFSRNVSAGWGVSDVGGAWTSSATYTSVNGSTGVMSLPASAATEAVLKSLNLTSSDVQYTVSQPTLPASGTIGSYALGRRTASGDYRAKVSVAANGAVTLRVMTYMSGTAATVQQLVVPGLTVTPGSAVNVRFVTSGSSPTTLRAKVWDAAGAEPTDWLVNTTNNTAGLQTSGSVGVIGYNNSPGAITMNFDNVKVTGAALAAVTNVALGKTATQSSDWGAVSPASNAVDANTSGNWRAGGMSSTNFQTDPWLTVDLGATYSLDSIKLYNRTDCCSTRLHDVHVFTSLTPFTGTTVAQTQAQAGVSAKLLPGVIGTTAQVTGVGKARYIRIQIQGADEMLTLGEVEAYGR